MVVKDPARRARLSAQSTIVTFHVRQPSLLSRRTESGQTTLTTPLRDALQSRLAAHCAAGAPWQLNPTLPSALSHFDPTDLLDALSTGIVMLDAQLVRHLRQRRRAGSARVQPEPGARPAVRRFSAGLERFDRHSAPRARYRRGHRRSRVDRAGRSARRATPASWM